jgi:AraC family transcriptional regulator
LNQVLDLAAVAHAAAKIGGQRRSHRRRVASERVGAGGVVVGVGHELPSSHSHQRLPSLSNSVWTPPQRGLRNLGFLKGLNAILTIILITRPTPHPCEEFSARCVMPLRRTRTTIARMESAIMSDMSISLNGAREIPALPQPAVPMAQAVLSMLGSARRALWEDPRQAEMYMEMASRLLEAPSAPPPISGLAAWQARKVTQHIAENLDRPISNGELADLASLSANHFSRAFKRSFGVSPHGFVIRSRLHRARTLMLLTSLPLSQIALECGFCDQAHMCRTFHRAVETRRAVGGGQTFRRRFQRPSVPSQAPDPELRRRLDPVEMQVFKASPHLASLRWMKVSLTCRAFQRIRTRYLT